MALTSSDPLRTRRELFAAALREKTLREERKIQSDLGEKGRPGGLLHFVAYFWHVLEPNTKFVGGWALEAMCLHLEAVTRGEITRLIINVPPGFMKSLLVNVFWPLWEWGAADKAFERYVTFAYAAHLTERDNQRFRDIIRSPAFRELWGDSFKLTADGVVKPTNDRMGWKFSSSVRGVGTGERGSRVLADDLHNVKEGESETVRTETVRWAREGMSNRLNDMMNGVIILIGQRVHEDDVCSAMLKDDLGFEHLVIPMEYDPRWHCTTGIGWTDPREEPGELAWPERFPQEVVQRLKTTLGPYAYSAQYQQTPEPRGGGILKRDWWQEYELPIGAAFRHNFELVVASLDPAFTAKQENDPSGFTVWGLYYERGVANIVMLHAWQRWLEMHGQVMERLPTETNKAYEKRASKSWGLVEWVLYDCQRLRVNTLLIEAKASGLTVAQEMRRLYGETKFGTLLVDPGAQDKRARAYSVQHLLAGGVVHAPASVSGDLLVYREWAQEVINECAKFRGLPGEEDNLVDSTTQAWRWMRDRGLLVLSEERNALETARATHKPQRQILYEV